MASVSKCPFCGGDVRTDERICPNCGGTNDRYTSGGRGTWLLPKTIEELKEHCGERGIPLKRLRFFIGEDYRSPKAYGIFRAGENRVVVYKNKADGSRSVRYDGPDEAYAVSEIYAKLLEVCRNNGMLELQD